MDPEEYLKPDFDVSKLTIPKLRSILIDQKVKYSSSANKSKLVELFNEEVKPKAPQLLEQYKKAGVANPNGIIFMYSPQEKKTEKTEVKKAEKGEHDKVSTITTSTESNEEGKKGDVDETSFSKENVFQGASTSKSPSVGLIKSPRKSQKENSEKSPISTSKKNDKVIPRKRSSPVDDEESRRTVKKKILRRGAQGVNDSLNSDSSVSATASPIDRSTLSFEKFENVNLDSLMEQFQKNPTGIESPGLKKTSDSVNILDHYKKSLPGGKVMKKQGSTAKRLQKKLKTISAKEQGKENKIPKSPAEKDNSVADHSGPILYSPTSTQKDIDVSVASIQSSNTFLSANSTGNGSPTSIKAFGHGVQSNIEIISGPKRKISRISFQDDEETIKSDGSDIDAEFKIEKALDVNSDDVDGTTDIEIESGNEDDANGILSDEPKENPKKDIQLKKSTVEESSFLVRLAIFISKAFLFLALVVILVLFGYYRDMKLKVGYCNIANNDLHTPSSWSAIPESFHSELEPLHPYLNRMDTLLSEHVTPSCAICPNHASCYQNSRMICDHDYTVHYPLKSLFGLIPNQETCVFDEHAEQKRLLLMKYTLNLLRSRQDRPLSLDELYMYLKTTKASTISDKDFDKYWDRFVDNELATEPELVLDLKTKTISIQHKTPINFFTRKPGDRRSRKFLVPTASANTQAEKKDVEA